MNGKRESPKFSKRFRSVRKSERDIRERPMYKATIIYDEDNLRELDISSSFQKPAHHE